MSIKKPFVVYHYQNHIDVGNDKPFENNKFQNYTYVNVSVAFRRRSISESACDFQLVFLGITVSEASSSIKSTSCSGISIDTLKLFD